MGVERDLTGRWAVLRLNAPPLNLIDRQTYLDLLAGLAEVERRPELGAVVVTAAGNRAFSAGADLKEIERTDPAEAEAFAAWRRWAVHELFTRLSSMPVPTVAAVNGLAYGVGCMIAAACDLRIAAETASFALPEVRLGVVGGADELATTNLPTGWHRLLVLTGDPIGAVTAYHAGLVQRVVPAPELAAATDALLGRMLSNGAESLRRVKRHLLGPAPEPR